MSEHQSTLPPLKAGDEFTHSGQTWIVVDTHGNGLWAFLKGNPRETANFKQSAHACSCKRCGDGIDPGQPDGGADERLCLRCWQEDWHD